jgi:hypothetical protein
MELRHYDIGQMSSGKIVCKYESMLHQAPPVVLSVPRLVGAMNEICLSRPGLAGIAMTFAKASELAS